MFRRRKEGETMNEDKQVKDNYGNDILERKRMVIITIERGK
jgi:hypothetical protein